MKNILILVESIDVNSSSGAKANYALIQNLALLGYKVKVLHYSGKHIEIEGVELVEIEENKFSILYFLSRFQRVISRYLKIDFSVILENLFGHSFTFFNDCNSIKSTVIKNYNKEDLIITLSQGASFRPHYALLQLPQLYCKWLAYVHDPYPFHYYPRPYNWVEKGYLFKYKFFKKISEKARYSAFPSKLLMEWMGSYYPNFLKTGLIIPHQISNTFSKDNSKYEFDFFDDKMFNILHAGNLMKPRDPRGLIEGFKLFLDKYPEARTFSKLLLIGPSSYHKNYLEKQINDNIYWSKISMRYKYVNYIQNNVSVNVIIEAKSEISPFLPAKFANCVKANKPIIQLGPYYSEVKRLLGHEYPYLSEIDNVDLISEILADLFLKWKANSNILKLNRKDLVDYLGKKQLSITMSKLLI